MPKRTKFEAHAICLVDRPSPIFAAAAVGTACLRLDFDKRLPSATWLRQALMKLKDVHEFWRVTGIVINMRPDFAIRYSIDGAPLEMLDRPAVLPIAYTAPLLRKDVEQRRVADRPRPPH